MCQRHAHLRMVWPQDEPATEEESNVEDTRADDEA